MGIAILAAASWTFLLWKDHAYHERPLFAQHLLGQIESVLMAGFYTLILIITVSFLYRHFLLSRVVYCFGFISAVFFIILVRVGFSLMGRYLAKNRIVVEQYLVLGSREAMELLPESFKYNGGNHLVGRLGWDAEDWANGETAFLGQGEAIEEVYKTTRFTLVIVPGYGRCNEDGIEGRRAALIHVVNFCEKKNIPVYMVPSFLDVAVSRRDVGSLLGVPLFQLRDSSVHPVYTLAKRLLDIVLALAVLLPGLPLWLLIALLIKLYDKGSVFYVQERVGLHGSSLRMIKFRSMIKGADRRLKLIVDFDSLAEPVFNIRVDPRVTPIGRILRRTSLDEIPQFVNVLLGSMSVVGPRPERSELVKKYNNYQRRRLKAKPGITGYQQIMSRGEPSLAKRVEYDLYYLHHQSIVLDFIIMVKTLLVIVRGDGTK